MTNVARLKAGTAWSSILTTELNSLATATACTASSAITNGSALDLLMDISILLGSFNPSGTPYLEIHLVPLLGDGSTYADRNASTLVDTVLVNTGSSAKAVASLNIPLPPGSFKVVIVNQTGATLAASANTVHYRTTNYDLNG